MKWAAACCISTFHWTCALQSNPCQHSAKLWFRNGDRVGLIPVPSGQGDRIQAIYRLLGKPGWLGKKTDHFDRYPVTETMMQEVAAVVKKAVTEELAKRAGKPPSADEVYCAQFYGRGVPPVKHKSKRQQRRAPSKAHGPRSSITKSRKL